MWAGHSGNDLSLLHDGAGLQLKWAKMERIAQVRPYVWALSLAFSWHVTSSGAGMAKMTFLVACLVPGLVWPEQLVISLFL